MSIDEVESFVVSSAVLERKPRKAPPWAFEFARQGEDRDVPRTLIRKRPAKANSQVPSLGKKESP